MQQWIKAADRKPTKEGFYKTRHGQLESRLYYWTDVQMFQSFVDEWLDESTSTPIEGEPTEKEMWAQVINDARWYDGSPITMERIIEHWKEQGYNLSKRQATQQKNDNPINEKL